MTMMVRLREWLHDWSLFLIGLLLVASLGFPVWLDHQRGVTETRDRTKQVDQVKAVEDCINNSLAQRTAPGFETDNQVTREYIAAQRALADANAPVAASLLQAINATTPAQKAAANAAFIKAFLAQQPIAEAAAMQTAKTNDTLNANDKWRQAHPLGRC